jgi:hypothetical protein
VEELFAQAEANGYQRGAHVERDQVRNKEKHGDKTKKDQNATLHRYVLWPKSPLPCFLTYQRFPVQMDARRDVA